MHNTIGFGLVKNSGQSIKWASICVLLLTVFQGCKDETAAVELEDREVFIQFVNNSNKNFSYLQGVFETNYGEFFVNHGELASGEVSDPIKLPSASHDVRRAYLKGEIDGLNALEIEFGFQNFDETPFIDGEYFYVIDLKPERLGAYKNPEKEESDYSPEIDYNGNTVRVRFYNEGLFDLTDLTIYGFRDECKPASIGFDSPCGNDIWEEISHIEYLPRGGYTSYIDVEYFYKSPKINGSSVLGTPVNYAGIGDHGPWFGGKLEEGAYTYSIGVEDKSLIKSEWDNSLFYLDTVIDSLVVD